MDRGLIISLLLLHRVIMDGLYRRAAVTTALVILLTHGHYTLVKWRRQVVTTRCLGTAQIVERVESC